MAPKRRIPAKSAAKPKRRAKSQSVAKVSEPTTAKPTSNSAPPAPRRSTRLLQRQLRPEPGYYPEAINERYGLLIEYVQKGGIRFPGLSVRSHPTDPSIRVLRISRDITRQHLSNLRALDHPNIIEYVDGYFQPDQNRRFTFVTPDGDAQVQGNAIFVRLAELDSLREFRVNHLKDVGVIPEEFLWHVLASITDALGYLYYGFKTSDELLKQEGISAGPHEFGWIPTSHRNVWQGSIFMTTNGTAGNDQEYPKIVLGDFNTSITKRDGRDLRNYSRARRGGSAPPRFETNEDYDKWWAHNEREDIRGLLYAVGKLAQMKVHGHPRQPYPRHTEFPPDYSAAVRVLLSDWVVERRSALPRFKTVRDLAEFIQMNRPDVQKPFVPLNPKALHHVIRSPDVDDPQTPARVYVDTTVGPPDDESEICTDWGSYDGDEDYADYIERVLPSDSEDEDSVVGRRARKGAILRDNAYLPQTSRLSPQRPKDPRSPVVTRGSSRSKSTSTSSSNSARTPKSALRKPKVEIDWTQRPHMRQLKHVRIDAPSPTAGPPIKTGTRPNGTFNRPRPLTSKDLDMWEASMDEQQWRKRRGPRPYDENDFTMHMNNYGSPRPPRNGYGSTSRLPAIGIEQWIRAQPDERSGSSRGNGAGGDGGGGGQGGSSGSGGRGYDDDRDTNTPSSMSKSDPKTNSPSSTSSKKRKADDDTYDADSERSMRLDGPLSVHWRDRPVMHARTGPNLPRPQPYLDIVVRSERQRSHGPTSYSPSTASRSTPRGSRWTTNTPIPSTGCGTGTSPCSTCCPVCNCGDHCMCRGGTELPYTPSSEPHTSDLCDTCFPSSFYKKCCMSCPICRTAPACVCVPRPDCINCCNSCPRCYCMLSDSRCSRNSCSICSRSDSPRTPTPGSGTRFGPCPRIPSSPASSQHRRPPRQHRDEGMPAPT
jgi:hypothetical protein